MLTSPGPILLQIGPLIIRWYGLLIAVGIVLCYGYILRELRHRKLSRIPIDDMAFWVILAGIIGARLYYVLFNLEYFAANPIDIPAIWKGGLAIHGALLGGAAAFFFFVFLKKLSWKLYADIIIPGVLFAQGIGRWGNFFNNEAFGSPTDLPWGVLIPLANRPDGYESVSYFHPTFLYESLWDICGFLILAALNRRLSHHPKWHGAVLFMYCIWYSVGRFVIEALRLDSLYAGSLRTAQIASVLLGIFGICGLIFLYRRSRIHNAS